MRINKSSQINIFIRTPVIQHIPPNLNNLLMLLNLIPLTMNQKALNHKLCSFIGGVLWNYSHSVIISLLLSLNTHRNWDVWHSLYYYHAKSPDLSAALSDVTLSVLLTKVALVVAHQITKRAHGARCENTLSQPFVPAKTKTCTFSWQMMP